MKNYINKIFNFKHLKNLINLQFIFNINFKKITSLINIKIIKKKNINKIL